MVLVGLAVGPARRVARRGAELGVLGAVPALVAVAKPRVIGSSLRRTAVGGLQTGSMSGRSERFAEIDVEEQFVSVRDVDSRVDGDIGTGANRSRPPPANFTGAEPTSLSRCETCPAETKATGTEASE